MQNVLIKIMAIVLNMKKLRNKDIGRVICPCCKEQVDERDTIVYKGRFVFCEDCREKENDGNYVQEKICSCLMGKR